MLTLTLPVSAWIFTPLFLLVGMKLMQSSGILFARGQDWHAVTLLAVLCNFGVFAGFGFALLLQNLQIN